MKTHFKGLDVLRGLGIFILLMMHTAFYHYDGLYDLDLNNPPLIVTIIGLLLMFAGIFAMISGFVHATQYRYKQSVLGYSNKQIMRYSLFSSLFILIVAYLYFIFTGPGLVNMATKSMNNSIFVEWINSGILSGSNWDRILYVDSLVMIGMNIALLACIYLWVVKVAKHKQAWFSLIFALLIFVISLIRLPLFEIYMNAIDSDNALVILALNWFVNKNNPILPFLAFGLIGQALALFYIEKGYKTCRNVALIEGSFMFIVGVILYIILPDTMLERSIDMIWYAIMMAQFGLFQLIFIFFIKLYDQSKRTKMNVISRALSRFSCAGLTIFFFESVFSALIHRGLLILMPNLVISLYGSLLFGLSLALFWTFILYLWEKKHYKYSIEYIISHALAKVGHSHKQDKLEGKQV